MTWYRDRETRDAAWRTFQTHPDWAALRTRPEFAHTATDNLARLLTPLDYSQY